jgi:hypothetical protein
VANRDALGNPVGKKPVAHSTRLHALSIAEVSGVDGPANMLDGWMVLKARGLADEDGNLTPDGARVVLKALSEGKLQPVDVLTDEELRLAQAMQKSPPRSFLSFFSPRPPGGAT